MLAQYLLLGHLLGDFTFQTDKIAIRKGAYWQWTLAHAIIVTSLMLALTYPFQFNIIALVLLNGVLHYLIDLCKIKIQNKKSIFQLGYFFFDQTVHISIVFLTSALFSNTNSERLIASNLITFSIIIILITSFSAIWIQFILLLIFRLNNRSFFLGNEKYIGVFTRIGVFSIGYLNLFSSKLFLGAIIILANEYNYRQKLNKYVSRKYFIIKLVLDLIVPLLAILILKI